VHFAPLDANNEQSWKMHHFASRSARADNEAQEFAREPHFSLVRAKKTVVLISQAPKHGRNWLKALGGARRNANANARQNMPAKAQFRRAFR
jgi:hypothetical protein